MKHDILNWFPFWCGFHFKRFAKPQYGCYAWRMCIGYIEVRKWAVEVPK